MLTNVKIGLFSFVISASKSGIIVIEEYLAGRIIKEI